MTVPIGPDTLISRLVMLFLLKNIPVGTVIHNIELKPGKGGQRCSFSGASSSILLSGKEEKYVLVRPSSGEVRMVLATCRATIGTVGNDEHALIIKVRLVVLVMLVNVHTFVVLL